MDFSKKMEELESILKSLEGETISLETALVEFEKGIKLVKECRVFLEKAKQKVSMLTESGEIPYTERKG